MSIHMSMHLSIPNVYSHAYAHFCPHVRMNAYIDVISIQCETCCVQHAECATWNRTQKCIPDMHVLACMLSARLPACTHAHMHSCPPARQPTCIRAHPSACLPARIHVCTHTHMHPCMCTCTYDRCFWVTPAVLKDKAVDEALNSGRSAFDLSNSELQAKLDASELKVIEAAGD